MNLEAAKYCREIRGELIVEPDFNAIVADDLPFLARVAGDLRAASNPAMPAPSPVSSIALPALETVGGSVTFGPLAELAFVSLPRLVSVNGDVTFGLAPVQRISLPALVTVNGDLSLVAGLTKLVQLDVPKLTTVGGMLGMIGLCRLPWHQAEPISTLGTTQAVFDVGCCTSSAAHACSSNICACN